MLKVFILSAKILLNAMMVSVIMQCRGVVHIHNSSWARLFLNNFCYKIGIY